MSKHSFLFNPGNWIGEGKIILNLIEDELFFKTNWSVLNRDFAGKVACAQDIKIEGIADNMRNELMFYNFGEKEFTVDMENQNIGRIVGIGVYDENTIAWEFRNNDLNFEGFETYVRQPDGSYDMSGEYITSDQFRTQIQARIWEGPTENTEGPEGESPF